ncbi:hypothetical protein K7X08_002882 [Anisodus acutangulus]|uniref:Uncharacterized protein n=1 Tax=Anisodus acutangulus TaxID=402998 RepID=A0A9Q1MCK8_9SOLA|nr:hypothetical protein K7X08_002882 [Anisodus acutangulus]
MPVEIRTQIPIGLLTCTSEICSGRKNSIEGPPPLFLLPLLPTLPHPHPWISFSGHNHHPTIRRTYMTV